MLLVDNQFNRSMGLGNKLFSWSRAYCSTLLTNAVQVEPRWFAVRNAAVLRGGIDYTSIFGKIFLLDNFRSDPKTINRVLIHGLQFFGLDHFKKFYISDLNDLKRHTWSDGDWIIFRCDQNHNFVDLVDFRWQIKEKLVSISRLRHKYNYSKLQPYIGVNYRSGNDFSSLAGVHSQVKTDQNWFARAIDWVRREYGDMPVYIVSDGAVHHMSPLIAGLKNYKLCKFRTAIEDLSFLANANVLLASGNSSFSAWAAFLSGADSYSSSHTPLDKWCISKESSNQYIGIIE